MQRRYGSGFGESCVLDQQAPNAFYITLFAKFVPIQNPIHWGAAGWHRNNGVTLGFCSPALLQPIAPLGPRRQEDSRLNELFGQGGGQWWTIQESLFVQLANNRSVWADGVGRLVGWSYSRTFTLGPHGFIMANIVFCFGNWQNNISTSPLPLIRNVCGWGIVVSLATFIIIILLSTCSPSIGSPSHPPLCSIQVTRFR